MIISENKRPEFNEFRRLMNVTDALLNAEAVGRELYYKKRNGTDLEEDVCDALIRSARGTSFENTIQLVSGASFPDIVAAGYYGVEVKSTNKNQWKSIGSSILESTRIDGVGKIFLTFGKLGEPVEFRSRPYEECLYGISVTHYPRYQIDMELCEGQTIFDKIGVPYDELRKMDKPVAPVAEYYKKKLNPGESLWWADGTDIENTESPLTIRLWTATTPAEKEELAAQGYALFPEILSSSSSKYNRYSLWLVREKGIVNTNVRDSFSAGGRVSMPTPGGVEILMPAAFGRIRQYESLIRSTIWNTDENELKDCWNVKKVARDRIRQWCELASDYAASGDSLRRASAWNVLSVIFPSINYSTAAHTSYPQYPQNKEPQLYVAEEKKNEF